MGLASNLSVERAPKGAWPMGKVSRVAIAAAVCAAMLAATPASAQTTRSIAITPDVDLVDGDEVTIVGSGFSPNAEIFYCQGVVDGTPGPEDCGTPILSTAADANGEFSTTLLVQRFLAPSSLGAVVDCAQPSATCGIGAADFLAPGGEIVVEPITFLPQDPADDPFEIVGTVVDAGGAPVPDVDVWAYLPSDTWVGSLQTTTDANGSYVLDEAVPLSQYRLRFGAPPGSGLVSEWAPDIVGGDGSPSRTFAAAVIVSVAQPVGQVDVVLEAGASIEGAVEDSTGNPVAGTLVWLYGLGDTLFGSYVTVTEPDGTYRIDDVWPREYRVRFVPPVGSGLRVEWFDDTTVRADAVWVSLDAGQVAGASAQLA